MNDLSHDVSGIGTDDVETDDEFPPFGFLARPDVPPGRDRALNLAFRVQDADADGDHLPPLDPTLATLVVSRRSSPGAGAQHTARGSVLLPHMRFGGPKRPRPNRE